MSPRSTSNTVAFHLPDDHESLDVLRRKLKFRAWSRGTREADLLIGTFADRRLPEFDVEALRQFERLLEEDDSNIDDWIAGRRIIPTEHDNRVVAMLFVFLDLAAFPRSILSCDQSCR